MNPSALPRLREWLERPEIASLDPRRIEALVAALTGSDPPVRVERWGTVVGYEAGPPRRRLVQFDRHGHLMAACRWSPNGALDWARCRAADGGWIGVEPDAIEHPAWGRSDRVWILDREETWGEEPWRPVEPLTVFRSLDWAALDHIPPLAEPRRLPPGAGSAVLNLVAALMKDQGVARVRYRGPFPSEQLFTTLLECFRYDPGQALPLERFLADGGLDWLPAPYESHQVAPWVTVRLREGIDTVVADGVAFSRPDWQGVVRREPRVVREAGERVVCSLWALGGPIEDRLVLDRSGEVLEVPAPRAGAAPPAPLPPVWRPALADLIARDSAPPLAGAIGEVMGSLELEWGPVAGDLLSVSGQRIRLSRRLREAAAASLGGAASAQECAEQALRFILEIARLLGPEVRGRAQSRLERLDAAAQRRVWEEGGGDPPEVLGESVGRLVALVARGGG